MDKLMTKIRVTEADSLSDCIVRNYQVDVNAKKDAFVAATMAELEQLSSQVTAAVLQDKAFSSLDSADAERDDAVLALGAILTGYAALPIAAKQTAAEPLKAIYDKYDRAGITHINDANASPMIARLLEELSSDTLAENAAALEGVSEAIANVRAAQNAFVAAADAYRQTTADKGISAAVYKKQLLAVINDKLVPYLTAMQIADNANCAAFADHVGAEINRVNEMIGRRGKR